jgi:hypothetical protein
LFHNMQLLLLPFLFFFFFSYLPPVCLVMCECNPFRIFPFWQPHRNRLRFRLNHHFTPCNLKAEKNWSCQKISEFPLADRWSVVPWKPPRAVAVLRICIN